MRIDTRQVVLWLCLAALPLWFACSGSDEDSNDNPGSDNEIAGDSDSDTDTDTDTDGDGDIDADGGTDTNTSHFVAFMHVNVNCSDFEVSLKFYEKLEFTILSIEGFGDLVFEDEVDAEFAKGLDLDPYKLVAAPISLQADESIIDLIEFKEPFDERPPYSQVNHLGITMITLETTDLDADMATLKEQGIQFLSDPVTVGSGNYRFAAMKDPDGNVIQLLENKNAEPGISYPGKKLNITKFLHVTVNTSDIVHSREFYQDVGFELADEANVTGAKEMGQAFGLEGEYKTKTALMKLEEGPGILLQQWEQPLFDPESPYEKLNHIGYSRIAIETTDIEADVKRLEDLGIEFYSEPKKPEGMLAFITFACFEDPDGTVLEAAHNAMPPIPGT